MFSEVRRARQFESLPTVIVHNSKQKCSGFCPKKQAEHHKASISLTELLQSATADSVDQIFTFPHGNWAAAKLTQTKFKGTLRKV